MSKLIKFQWKNHTGSNLEIQAQEALYFCKHALNTDTFKRGDYKELCQLIVVYLGGVVQDFQFKRPGACHHARFMAKAIYSIKMAMLGDLNIVDNEMEKVILETAEFSAIFYGPWFLKSAVPQCAPGNDLAVIDQMKCYQEEKPILAKAVLNAMQRHMWYFTPQLVVLALVDDDLEDSIRKSLASKLIEIPFPDTFSVGRPEFPNIFLDIKLEDMVSQDSWFFFRVTDQEDQDHHSWLKSDVTDWQRNEHYQRFKDFLCKLDVVNDRAERGVKLIQDFIDTSHSESTLQDLLIVVSNERSKLPNLNKVLLSTGFLCQTLIFAAWRIRIRLDPFHFGQPDPFYLAKSAKIMENFHKK